MDHKDHPEIAELSSLLNELPIHPRRKRTPEFRNPAGISMKLGNFLSLDPEHSGTGLKRRSQLDEAVWEDFAENVPKLHQVAKAIRSTHSSLGASNVAAFDQFNYEVESFREGKILALVHYRRERDRKAVRRA